MKNYPFIKYTLVFILGIFSSYLFPPSFNTALLTLVISILSLITTKFLIKHHLSGKVFIILSYLVFFSIGSFLFIHKQHSITLMPSDASNKEEMIVIGNVSSIDLIKGTGLTFTIITDSIRINNQYKVLEVSLICRVRDKSNHLTKLYNDLLPGQKIRVEGIFQRGRIKKNPGEFDYHNYLTARGISGLFIVRNTYAVKKLDWDGNVFLSTIFRLRKYIDSRITLLHDSQTAGLLRGLILADRSQIDEDIKTDFINTGVTHILSVSGLHVGYIFIIFTVLFGRLNIFLRSILILIGLILFMLLTGFFASVFRAVVMSAVLILNQISNRSTNLFNSLAIAAFIVLAVNPNELFDAGFQLSFLAVLSIAIIYPMIEQLTKALKVKSAIIKYTFLFMGVSLSAQLGTLPLTLIYFGKLSIISLVTNLFVIPISGLIVGIGILTILLSDLVPFLAGIYASANDILTFVMYRFVSFASDFKYSFLPIRNFSLIDTILFYTTIVLLIIGLKKLSTAKAKIIFSILIIGNCVFFSRLDNDELFNNGKLNMMTIALNQGNSTLISFPNGKTVLLNAGAATFYFDSGERIIRPLLSHIGVEKIDYAIISSIKSENYGGLISLIRQGILKCIVKPITDTSNMVDAKLEELINSQDIPIKYFQKSSLEIGNAKLYAFNTAINFVSNNQQKHNPTLVFKIVYGNTSILFSGDTKNEIESAYDDAYKGFLKSDVLVVASYEESSNLNVQFLKTVGPKISLISCVNPNKFDKEYPINLEQFKKYSSEIYQIDQGAIILQSDGNRITKVNWK